MAERMTFRAFREYWLRPPDVRWGKPEDEVDAGENARIDQMWQAAIEKGTVEPIEEDAHGA